MAITPSHTTLKHVENQIVTEISIELLSGVIKSLHYALTLLKRLRWSLTFLSNIACIMFNGNMLELTECWQLGAHADITRSR